MQHVLGVGDAAQHAIGDREQKGPVLLEQIVVTLAARGLALRRPRIGRLVWRGDALLHEPIVGATRSRCHERMVRATRSGSSHTTSGPMVPIGQASSRSHAGLVISVSGDTEKFLCIPGKTGKACVL